MSKNDLLKMVGFSQEFISRLEEYENTVIEIPAHDFSFETDQFKINDSTRLLMENICSNAETNLTVILK